MSVCECPPGRAGTRAQSQGTLVIQLNVNSAKVKTEYSICCENRHGGLWELHRVGPRSWWNLGSSYTFYPLPSHLQKSLRKMKRNAELEAWSKNQLIKYKFDKEITGLDWICLISLRKKGEEFVLLCFSIFRSSNFCQPKFCELS